MSRTTAQNEWASLSVPAHRMECLAGNPFRIWWASALGRDTLPSTLVNVLAEFEKPEQEWFWIMRSTVAGALEKMGWVEEEHSEIREEVDMTAPLYEGAVRRIAGSNWHLLTPVNPV